MVKQIKLVLNDDEFKEFEKYKIKENSKGWKEFFQLLLNKHIKGVKN